MARRVTRTLLLSIAVLALAACGGASTSSDSSGSATSRFAGTELTPPPAAPDFSLQDQDRRAVRLSSLRGKVVFVTFLYAHCPDVCPLIATNLNVVLHRLGAKRTGVRVLAVSVDPTGDTVPAVRQFVHAHALLPEFHFLRGTRSELAPIWKRYHIAVSPTPEDTVDHSAYTVLIDGAGKERVLYDAQIRPADVLHDLRLVGQPASSG